MKSLSRDPFTQWKRLVEHNIESIEGGCAFGIQEIHSRRTCFNTLNLKHGNYTFQNKQTVENVASESDESMRKMSSELADFRTTLTQEDIARCLNSELNSLDVKWDGENNDVHSKMSRRRVLDKTQFEIRGTEEWCPLCNNLEDSDKIDNTSTNQVNVSVSSATDSKPLVFNSDFIISSDFSNNLVLNIENLEVKMQTGVGTKDAIVSFKECRLCPKKVVISTHYEYTNEDTNLDNEKVSASDLGNKKVCEGDLENEKVSTRDFENEKVSTTFTRDLDIAKVSTQDLDNKRICERDLDNEKVSTRDLDNKKVCKEDLDNEKVSTRDLDNKKVCEGDLDNEKVSTRDLDNAKVSTRELDNKKVCEGDLDIEKVSTRDLDNKKVCERHLDNAKVSTRDLDNKKVCERDLDNAKVSTRDLDNKKVCERDLDNAKVSTRDLDNNKVCERDLDKEKVCEGDLDNEKVSTKDLDKSKVITRVLDSEKANTNDHCNKSINTRDHCNADVGTQDLSNENESAGDMWNVKDNARNWTYKKVRARGHEKVKTRDKYREKATECTKYWMKNVQNTLDSIDNASHLGNVYDDKYMKKQSIHTLVSSDRVNITDSNQSKTPCTNVDKRKCISNDKDRTYNMSGMNNTETTGCLYFQDQNEHTMNCNHFSDITTSDMSNEEGNSIKAVSLAIQTLETTAIDSKETKTQSSSKQLGCVPETFTFNPDNVDTSCCLVQREFSSTLPCNTGTNLMMPRGTTNQEQYNPFCELSCGDGFPKTDSFYVNRSKYAVCHSLFPCEPYKQNRVHKSSSVENIVVGDRCKTDKSRQNSLKRNRFDQMSNVSTDIKMSEHVMVNGVEDAWDGRNIGYCNVGDYVSLHCTEQSSAETIKSQVSTENRSSEVLTETSKSQISIKASESHVSEKISESKVSTETTTSQVSLEDYESHVSAETNILQPSTKIYKSQAPFKMCKSYVSSEMEESQFSVETSESQTSQKFYKSDPPSCKESWTKDSITSGYQSFRTSKHLTRNPMTQWQRLVELNLESVRCMKMDKVDHAKCGGGYFEATVLSKSTDLSTSNKFVEKTALEFETLLKNGSVLTDVEKDQKDFQKCCLSQSDNSNFKDIEFENRICEMYAGVTNITEPGHITGDIESPQTSLSYELKDTKADNYNLSLNTEGIDAQEYCDLTDDTFYADFSDVYDEEEEDEEVIDCPFLEYHSLSEKGSVYPTDKFTDVAPISVECMSQGKVCQSETITNSFNQGDPYISVAMDYGINHCISTIQPTSLVSHKSMNVNTTDFTAMIRWEVADSLNAYRLSNGSLLSDNEEEYTECCLQSTKVSQQKCLPEANKCTHLIGTTAELSRQEATKQIATGVDILDQTSDCEKDCHMSVQESKTRYKNENISSKCKKDLYNNNSGQMSMLSSHAAKISIRNAVLSDIWKSHVNAQPDHCTDCQQLDMEQSLDQRRSDSRDWSPHNKCGIVISANHIEDSCLTSALNIVDTEGNSIPVKYGSSTEMKYSEGTKVNYCKDTEVNNSKGDAVNYCKGMDVNYCKDVPVEVNYVKGTEVNYISDAEINSSSQYYHNHSYEISNVKCSYSPKEEHRKVLDNTIRLEEKPAVSVLNPLIRTEDNKPDLFNTSGHTNVMDAAGYKHEMHDVSRTGCQSTPVQVSQNYDQIASNLPSKGVLIDTKIKNTTVEVLDELSFPQDNDDKPQNTGWSRFSNYLGSIFRGFTKELSNESTKVNQKLNPQNKKIKIPLVNHNLKIVEHSFMEDKNTMCSCLETLPGDSDFLQYNAMQEEKSLTKMLNGSISLNSKNQEHVLIGFANNELPIDRGNPSLPGQMKVAENNLLDQTAESKAEISTWERLNTETDRNKFGTNHMRGDQLDERCATTVMSAYDQINVSLFISSSNKMSDKMHKETRWEVTDESETKTLPSDAHEMCLDNKRISQTHKYGIRASDIKTKIPELMSQLSDIRTADFQNDDKSSLFKYNEEGAEKRNNIKPDHEHYIKMRYDNVQDTHTLMTNIQVDEPDLKHLCSSLKESQRMSCDVDQFDEDVSSVYEESSEYEDITESDCSLSEIEFAEDDIGQQHVGSIYVSASRSEDVFAPIQFLDRPVEITNKLTVSTDTVFKEPTLSEFFKDAVELDHMPDSIVCRGTQEVQGCCRGENIALVGSELFQSSLECLLEMLLQRGKVMHAVVANIEGEIIAKTVNCNLTKGEITSLICSLSSTYKGMIRISIFNDAYTCFKHDQDASLIGRSMSGGIFVARRGIQSIVVGFSDPKTPGSCIKEIQELSNLLRNRRL